MAVACDRSPQWYGIGLRLRAPEGCGLSAAASAAGALWDPPLFYGWGGAYARYIDPEQHQVGKEHTQKIESKHLNLRTRIKRLVRRTIGFSKTTTMHDLVIGLFMNRYEFGRLL